ncbi:MAG: aspartyl-phosphate phosphatase Spo0E family protein [Epulopiscium sp.]|nr:aspartyl-phosphate phosphatase Spo0E family protein [Candidatus Epulonipiscium sp.]
MPYGQVSSELRAKIEQVRERLNHLIDWDGSNISDLEILKLSQKLDDLLVEYLKEQHK